MQLATATSSHDFVQDMRFTKPLKELGRINFWSYNLFYANTRFAASNYVLQKD